MGRKKKLEFYNKANVEKIIKTIKRSRIYQSISTMEYIKRQEDYIKLDNMFTSFFEMYDKYTIELYINFRNNKHNYADKTCKNFLDRHLYYYDPYCQVSTMKNEWYPDIQREINEYIYDVLRLRDFNEQCKNHINLNRLKKTRIPNDVIDNIIKYFL